MVQHDDDDDDDDDDDKKELYLPFCFIIAIILF